MALFALFLRFLVTQLDTVVLAVFGWSVTALFGRLPGKKQLAVSCALGLSLVWPVFVVGLVVPSVAQWLRGLAKAERYAEPVVLDVVWVALAMAAPLVVGALTGWAAASKKIGALRSLIYGYPLAIGYIIAFLLTAWTVPLIKLESIIHGWDDRHVYVEPRKGRYDAVLRKLAAACARGDLVATLTDVPASMSLATRALTLFAHGMVSQIVTEQVRYLRADGIELYLYPSDLLLRGSPEKVAFVHAMMVHTDIDEDAFLVSTKRGQRLQNELRRLLEVVASHDERNFDVGATAGLRLVEIWGELNEMGDEELPFAEWLLLHSMAQRVERRLVHNELGRSLPLDHGHHALDAVVGVVDTAFEMALGTALAVLWRRGSGGRGREVAAAGR